MSYDDFLDCGILLSVQSRICPVCGFDNNFFKDQDIPGDETYLFDFGDDFIPENYPGY